MRADPREQLGEAKRLCHIIVGSGIESLDRVGFRTMPGQHDDRVIESFLTQLPDRRASIHIRQTDIHDDEVRRLFARRVESAPRRIRLNCHEFFVQGKLLGQGRAQIGVVVGDQDLKSRDHEPVLDGAGFLASNTSCIQ